MEEKTVLLAVELEKCHETIQTHRAQIDALRSAAVKDETERDNLAAQLERVQNKGANYE